MRLSSPLQARKYLTSVKMRMSGHFDHHERFTGFFLGSFFHITHHAEYEWDRRYKSLKMPRSDISNRQRMAVKFVSFLPEDYCVPLSSWFFSCSFA